MLGGDETAVPWKDWAHQEWWDRYGSKPPWMPKDFVLLAKALKAVGDETRARAAWKAFLASTDPFYEGHAPGKFVSSLSVWVAKMPKPKAAKKETPPARWEIMGRIAAEVDADPSIPEAGKKDEMARRWKEIP